MTDASDEEPTSHDDATSQEMIEGVLERFDQHGVPVLTQELLDLGKSAATAIALWDRWTHRKVESLSLLSGERARRRVSVDCTPPLIPWRESRLFGNDVEQACLVPLTLMRKGPLQSLDVVDDVGRSVPVLGKAANGLVAALSLAFWISVHLSGGDSLDADLDRVQPHWPEIYAIATSPREQALGRAKILNETLGLRTTPARLVEELAELFILLAVLPATAVQRRQVLKYSYHWEMEPIRKAAGRILPAFGLKPLTIELEVGALRTASSYHLECAVPEGLTATRISLPKSNGSAPTTVGPMKVAHVSCRYGIAEDGRESRARISFLPDHNRLLPRVMWSGLAVAVMFFALSLAPGLRDAMHKLPDAATAILLFIPAFFVGLNARVSENVIVGGLLLPLRIYALLLAGVVYVAGALLILNIWPDVSTLVLWTAATFGLLGFVPSCIGWIRQLVRTRV